MNALFRTAFTAVALLTMPICLSGQAPTLGATSSFAMFTGAGAFNNLGTSVVTGDIGTNVGAFSGFPPGVVIGDIHIADPVSAQAATDVLIAYEDLFELTCGLVIGTTLGGGQILTPNTYCTGAASTLNGDLVLDAEGDSNALFIFQIDGAFSTSTFASITLVNGASPCNVYWQVNGAFTLGDFSVFQGTVIATGQISLLQESTLIGRGLSTAGAIDMHTNVVSLVLPPVPPTIIADGPVTFCMGDSVILSGNCCGEWSNGETTFSITVTESGTYFATSTNECGSAESNQIIVTVNPIPDCAISGEFTICGAQTTEICASAGNAEYLWSTGETTACIIVGAVGDYTVTITDDNGCTNSCSQSITNLDLAPPDISCPADVTIACDENTQPANTGTATATDDCDSMPLISFTDTFEDGTCDQEYTISRTWTAMDISGNSSTCIQVITIEDAAIPTITCPTVISPVACGSTISFGDATASDGCDPGVIITFITDSIAGTCDQEYTLVRTWTATDDCGNTATCSASIVVEDTTGPTITCPPDVSAFCSTSTDPSVTGSATATDDCDTAPIISYTDDVTGGFCPIILLRTWTATDGCGNTSTCIQAISITDDTDPIITCPSVVSPIDCEMTPDFGTPVVSDDCDNDVLVTFSTDSIAGTCDHEYTLTRTWTATDDCGNTATCAVSIVVEDSTSPTITCPPDVNGICSISTDPSVTGSATSTDNCDSAPVITYSDGPMTGFCPIILLRTWTATDDCGNTATCIQTISITDDIDPVITCPTEVSPIPCGTTPVFGIPVATDNCDNDVLVTFSTDSIAGTCSQEYTLVRTWTATDDCGNTATCSSTIEVQDNMSPVIICPVVESPVECGATIFFGPATATDACDDSVEVTFSDVTVAGQCPQEYSVTRTWIATDDCGNTASCSRTINVEDSTPPVIVCPAVVSPIPCGAMPSFGTATASDVCDNSVGISFSDVIIPGACPQEYTVTRTWVATDDCANTASCSATIIVGGTTQLIINCPEDSSISCTEDLPAIDITMVTFSGNCGAVTVTHLNDDISNQSCLNSYTLTRTYQASDACGQIATCSQVFTVLDTTPPVITFPEPLPPQSGDTLLTQCYGQDPQWEVPTFDEGSILATDNCENDVVITYEISLEGEGDCTEDGFINLYRMTWTATDVCGNSSSAHLFLALVDTIPPVIEGVPDNITVNCENIPAPPIVYATDECLCACIVSFQETDQDPTACQDGLIILRTWTATDRCGNVTIDTQRITLIDEEGPMLSIIHPELTEYADGSVLEYTCNDGGIPSYFDLLDVEDVTSTGVCDSAAILTFSENSVIQTNCEFFGYIEQRVYKWTATDPCGNATILTIAVRLIDDEAPVISGLPEMVCIGDPLLNNIEVSDNCDHVSLRFWDVAVPNPCGEGFAKRRTYEAYDACGNIAVDTVILLPLTQDEPIIVFVDPEMAQIDSGLVMRMHCDAIGQHYTSFSIADVRVDGICAEGATIQFTETLLSTYDCVPGESMATVELKWTATGVCGAVVERIIIAEIIDESGPEFVNFSPVISIGCNDLLPQIFATDNCGEVILTYLDTIHQGVCEYDYDIHRLITATDLCGNVTTRHQIVHVGNDGGPAISGVEEFICDDLSIPQVTAYDACADEFVPVTMQQDTVDNECRDGLVIIRTWSATDACGHVTVIHQTIVINDLTPPEIFIPSYSVIHHFMGQLHRTVYHSETSLLERLNALEADHVYVTDDCDQLIIPVLTVDTLFAEDCEEEGYAERRIYTWTATDICGNTASVSFTVDIMDDMAPVFREMEFDTMIICAPLPPAPPIFLMDSTENVTIVFTETHGTGPGEGQITVVRTWIATDSCHNTSTYVQTFIWQQESTLECAIILPGAVECNSHGVVINSEILEGTGPYVYEWEVVGEKCFIQGGQGTPEILIYMGWSDVKIILTITDTFGCVSMCMVFMDCVDGIAIPLYSTFEDTEPSLTQDQSIFHAPLGANSENSDELARLSYYPNPADEVLHISFESETEGFVDFLFTDFLGKVVSMERLMVQKGINNKQLDVAALANGSYLIQIQSEKTNYTRGVIILHQE